MYLVLLSGGSGTRLWPLSNNVRSKQFIQLLENDDNELESMIQKVYRQLGKIGLNKRLLITTTESQKYLVRDQLGEQVEILIEPERRNTFPAIALSAVYLAFVKKVDLEETISVLPVDPYTDEDFFSCINRLEENLILSGSNLGLIGVEPTYPSEKYGYILLDANKVSAFVEKPNEDVAKQLIKKGALWNGGVFVFKLKYMLSIINKYIEFDSYESFLSQYHLLPKDSFDYVVSEKEKDITYVKYKGYWKDLGTWNTLTEEIETRTYGEVVISEDSSNTHVINELDIPIITLGINNAVVVASPNGILVSDKYESAKLKDFLNEDIINNYTFEFHEWGFSRIIDIIEQNHENVKIIHYKLNKNSELNLFVKENESMIVDILEGNGKYTMDSSSWVQYHNEVELIRLQNHINQISFLPETDTQMIVRLKSKT